MKLKYKFKTIAEDSCHRFTFTMVVPEASKAYSLHQVFFNITVLNVNDTPVLIGQIHSVHSYLQQLIYDTT